MRVGDQEILIPTSMVGNTPNPRWFDAHYARMWQGEQYPPDAAMYEAFQDAMQALVKDQEDAGLDIITDARIQGDNYAEQALYYYLRRLGAKIHGSQFGFPIYSRLHTGTLEQKIRRQGPIMVEQAKALKRATGRATKVQYTGPQVLAQSLNDLYYDNPRDRAMDIAKALNEDLREVDALGVDFIQIDEFTWPYFWEDWAVEAFNATVEGVTNAQIVVHVCWGNWGGTPGYAADDSLGEGGIYDIAKRTGAAPEATASIVPKVYETNFNVLNLESCGRRSDDLSGLDVMKNHPLPDNVSFWAGVIDVKSTITETAETVRDRILTLAEYVDPSRLGVTTDCGLTMIQRHIATTKVHALVAGAELARKELA